MSEEDRYSRLRLIPWWDQKTMSQARFMVVGAGALGNEILKNLALVGAGHILIVDFDNVELSNLSRSVLFRSGDVGQRKAEVAAQRTMEINPDVQAAFFCGDITVETGSGAFRDFDVVLAGVDNFKARIFINRACEKTGVPWINGGIQDMVGEVHVYIPGKGACFECNLPQQAYKELAHRLSCLPPVQEADRDRVPTTPTIASIIAAIQVQEALKLVHGIEVRGGSGLIFNGLKNECLPVLFKQNGQCLQHSRTGPVTRIEGSVAALTVEKLLDRLDGDAGEGGRIMLEYDLVYRLDCACGTSVDKLFRLNAMKQEDYMCPACGKLMVASMTSVADRTSPFKDRTLAECHIPPSEIITVKNAGSEYCIELDGDRDSIFKFV
jgi:adenylyltransferase/sulfurtransferase